MPSLPASPTEFPVHDADRDGNLFVWVLALARHQRDEALARAGRQREVSLAAARKFHEFPPEPAARSPIASHSRIA